MFSWYLYFVGYSWDGKSLITYFSSTSIRSSFVAWMYETLRRFFSSSSATKIFWIINSIWQIFLHYAQQVHNTVTMQCIAPILLSFLTNKSPWKVLTDQFQVWHMSSNPTVAVLLLAECFTDFWRLSDWILKIRFLVLNPI